MKRYFSIILAVILACTAVIMTGCDDDKGKGKTGTEATTSAAKSSAASNTKAKTKKPDNKKTIKEYLDGFTEGSSDIYGPWQVKGFNYMTLVFRNDNLAEMVMGTEGYFSSYTFNPSGKTLTVQLMPGVIDGQYGYKFSDNKKKITLTLNGKKMILIKKDKFSIVPKAPKKPKIDRNILGWWKNSEGMKYCFQDDGVMYENSISMETCYTYTIENGKIKAKYSTGGEPLDDEFTYTFNNGKFTLNNSKCKKL